MGAIWASLVVQFGVVSVALPICKVKTLHIIGSGLSGCVKSMGHGTKAYGRSSEPARNIKLGGE